MVFVNSIPQNNKITLETIHNARKTAHNLQTLDVTIVITTTWLPQETFQPARQQQVVVTRTRRCNRDNDQIEHSVGGAHDTHQQVTRLFFPFFYESPTVHRHSISSVTMIASVFREKKSTH